VVDFELEQASTIRLGGSYEALQNSEAFTDLIEFLEASCISLELKLAGISPEDKQFFHDYFMEWQQRKMVVMGIKARMENSISLKKQLEEELTNERTDDLGSSRTDTALPGY
jgi:hypothetical protein